MGAELSAVPGFGWANTSSSGGGIKRVVKMDPAGFVFDPATNEVALGELLRGRGRVPAEVYPEMLAALKAQVSDADYRELMGTNGLNGTSCMRFDVMMISPNTSFQVHAHPNLECIMVLQGCIHEYRFLGPNLTRARLADLDKRSPQPDLPSSQFALRSVAAPNCLVNQPGSVHLSFTRDDPETVLLVLWSGSHWSNFANTVPLILSPPLPSEVQPLS